MIDLYLDFDGVLVDTITVTYEMMKELGIEISNTNLVCNFYKNLDWNNLLNNINEIDKAFYYIQILKETKIYNISILTTVNSLQEMIAKIVYIRKKDKDINIICVPKGVEKCNVVKPKNSILVDDYSGNLNTWYENEGIPIKFSKEQNNKYLTIDSLKKLTESSFVKKLVKN